jgi:cbb3-type cytochrome oxidase subunit 1
VYYALPQITNREIPKSAKSFHFWTSTFGVLLLLLAYLIGGLTHGVLAGQPSLPWSSSVIQSIQPYFIITKVAFVILAFSQLVFVVNVWRVIFPNPVECLNNLKKEASV